jgi:uncharacterized DUF497 family protein
MDGARFEWDEAKAAANLIRHRVSFPEAITAFDDPSGFEVYDDRQDYGEERWVWFGRVQGRLLVVAIAFTERGERIRIISARPAEPAEEAAYFENREG